jgi:hypothetical protein
MADDLPLVQDVDVVVRDLQERQKRMFQAVSRAMGMVQQRQKGYYNLKVKGPEIQVGDWVVYEDKMNLRAGEICSLRLPYKTPLFQVARKLSNVNYAITSDGVQGPMKILHYNQIKRVEGPARASGNEVPDKVPTNEHEQQSCRLGPGRIPGDGIPTEASQQPRRSGRMRQRPERLGEDTRNLDIPWIP